jgi:hypothetical protein
MDSPVSDSEKEKVKEKQSGHQVTTTAASDDAPVEEEFPDSVKKRALRKIDLHLMLPLWVVFVFGFLDRINLGNVAVLGIMKELKLSGNDFAIAMQVFFVPYILLDIPSNIFLKKFVPSTWLSTLTFSWGKTTLASKSLQWNLNC